MTGGAGSLGVCFGVYELSLARCFLSAFRLPVSRAAFLPTPSHHSAKTQVVRPSSIHASACRWGLHGLQPLKLRSAELSMVGHALSRQQTPAARRQLLLLSGFSSPEFKE